MKREIELLAPGGDVDAIKAAIVAGANAIYCGLDKFNARNRAANITFDNLQGILRLAHEHDCEVFLTLNILIVDSEISALISLLNKLVNTSIDGVIVQDLGMLYLLSKYFPTLKIHASTQLTTHNVGQIAFLKKLKVERVNLSRELNIQEIKTLSDYSHSQQMLTEVFVHGSNCISFSGLCYMSSVQGGNSGNRGRCSQPCRDKYSTTETTREYPLNLKDNSAFSDLDALHDAGVDSLKIEGRIKKFDYVHTVVSTWRKQLSKYYKTSVVGTDNSALYKVFNRNFSNAFLKGNVGKDMFIDSPRDYSIKRLNKNNINPELLEEQELKLYKEKREIITTVIERINRLSIDKLPIDIVVSGSVGSPLKLTIKTKKRTFEVLSSLSLKDKGVQVLDYEVLYKRLKSINDTAFFIHEMNLDKLEGSLYIPYKELTAIKQKILFVLNESRTSVDPIEIPRIDRPHAVAFTPTLTVIISSLNDLDWCKDTSASIYYQLPNSIGDKLDQFVEVLKNNPSITPYFPAVLIGDDYHAAIALIEKVKPKQIVTNNTGIAHYACENNIPWIAGSQLNVCNTYSLQCLKETFNCMGAFVSNELSEVQIKGIKKPENFKLYYSIYHPISLMTSRQCLFQQVTGCYKQVMDENCIAQCEKTASITNLKETTFFVDKSAGNLNHLYNGHNFLNTAIVSKMPIPFDGFVIDLSSVKTQTKIDMDKPNVVALFENILDDNTAALTELKERMHSISNVQYTKGI